MNKSKAITLSILVLVLATVGLAIGYKLGNNRGRIRGFGDGWSDGSFNINILENELSILAKECSVDMGEMFDAGYALGIEQSK